MHPELKGMAPDIPLLRTALLQEAYEFLPQFVTNDTVFRKIGRVNRLLKECIERGQTGSWNVSHRSIFEEQLGNLEKFSSKTIKNADDIQSMRNASQECLSRLIADLALGIAMDELETEALPEATLEFALRFLSITESRFTVEAGLQNFRNENSSALTERDIPLLMKMAADILQKEVSVRY